jgi:hypothetical protein
MVTFTLRQVTAFVGAQGTQYQVTNEVTAATDASPATYVYKTATQAFSHYASAADMQSWPDSYDEARLLNREFYRAATVVRTWDTVAQMNVDLDMSKRRIQSLADELTAKRGDLIIDRTTVVTGS